MTINELIALDKSIDEKQRAVWSLEKEKERLLRQVILTDNAIADERSKLATLLSRWNRYEIREKKETA